MKLISCNIEKNRHLDRVKKLVVEEKPDVICLQEVLAPDVPEFEAAFGMTGQYVTMRYMEDVQAEQGVAIFSAMPMEAEVTHYAGAELAGPAQTDDRHAKSYQQEKQQLIVVNLSHQDGNFTVATTHLHVTKEGEATWFQREAVTALLSQLDKSEEVILCGDFNAPRGGEIFGVLVERFTDNIPASYTSSIDGDLHRAGAIPFMVDGLFTTPGYRTENVRLVSGVSDHCAIVADVYRTE